MYQQRWSDGAPAVIQPEISDDRQGGDGPADQFRVEIWPERERVRLAPVGELDLMSAPILDDCIAELSGVGFTWLRVDLRDVTFMDSAGLRVLLAAETRLKRQRARLEALNPRGQVLRFLALLAVDSTHPHEAVAEIFPGTTEVASTMPARTAVPPRCLSPTSSAKSGPERLTEPSDTRSTGSATGVGKRGRRDDPPPATSASDRPDRRRRRRPSALPTRRP